MSIVFMSEALKKQLQTLQAKAYVGRMTVHRLSSTGMDPITGIESTDWSVIISSAPCRISYKTATSTAQEVVGEVQQEIVLYCDPRYVIPEGSRIDVSQNNVTTVYQLSGKAAVYASHQEIPLKVFQEYA